MRNFSIPRSTCMNDSKSICLIVMASRAISIIALYGVESIYIILVLFKLNTTITNPLLVRHCNFQFIKHYKSIAEHCKNIFG